MTRNNPFAGLPDVPSFTLTSATIAEGEPLPAAQRSALFGVPGGQDLSPDLTWSNAPEATRSYAVTAYDPDAPTGSGFWHWAVMNLPATVTTIPVGAGTKESDVLPDTATQLRTDAGTAQYIGAAPPAGHGPHRYVFTVWALDVEQVDVPADATPAYLGFVMSGHTIGRATITATAEIHA